MKRGSRNNNKKMKKQPKSTTIQRSIFPKNIVQLTTPHCFICDEEIVGRGVPLLVGQTPYTKTGLPTKIGQLMGDGFMIVVSIEDMICKRCAVLLNHLDKLEADVEIVKASLTEFLKKKYQLLGEKLPLVNFNNEDATVYGQETEHLEDIDWQNITTNVNNSKNYESDSDLETSLLGNEKSKKVNVEIIMDEGRITSKLAKKFKMQTEYNEESKVYRCMACHFKTASLSVFNFHFQSCIALPFKCSMCDARFESHKNVRRHIMEQHLSSWTCHFCDMNFDQESLFTSHMSDHLTKKPTPGAETGGAKEPTKPDPFECNQCEFKTWTKELYDNHLRQHVVLKLFKCQVCSKRYEDEASLERHMKSHRLVVFKCGICSVDFQKKHEMLEHLTTHKTNQQFGNKMQKMSAQISRVIETVDVLSPDNPENVEMLEVEKELNENEKVASSEIEFHTCNICSLTFVNQLLYVQHMEMHKRTTGGVQSNESDKPPEEEMIENEPIIGQEAELELEDNQDYMELEHDTLEHMFEKIHADVNVTMTNDDGKQDDVRNKQLREIVLKCNTCNEEFPNTAHLQLHRMTQNHIDNCLETGEQFTAITNTQMISEHSEADASQTSELVITMEEDVNETNHNSSQDSNFVPMDETGMVLDNLCTTRIKSEPVDEEAEEVPSTSANDNEYFLEDDCENLEVAPKKKYVCAVCYFRSPTMEALRKHFKQHKMGKTFSCEVCEKEFPTNQKLKNHLKVHVKFVINVTCPYCYEELTDRFHMQQHMQEKHQKDKVVYRCAFCSEDFPTKKALKMHEESHPERFKCDQCEQLFRREKQLKDHKELAHRDPHCRYCGKEILKAKTLKNHELRHIREKDDFECDVCKRVFKTKTGLRHHVAVHTGEYKYCCDYCGRGFMSRMMMEEHRSMHTKEERYICDVCGRKFSFQSTYWIHRKWHDNPYPYKCSYCNRMFRHSSLLAVHKRKHTGERPYKCPHCPLTFPVGGTLKRHLILHTGAYPFNCENCKRGFTTRHKYAMHLAKTHGDYDLLNSKPQQGEFKMVIRDDVKKETVTAEMPTLWEVADESQSGQINFKLETVEDEDENGSQEVAEGIPCTIVAAENMLVGNIVPTRVVEIVLDETSHAVATVALDEDGSSILPDLWYQ